MVEKDKERPVNQPCPLLEGLQAGTKHTLVDKLAQPMINCFNENFGSYLKCFSFIS